MGGAAGPRIKSGVRERENPFMPGLRVRSDGWTAARTRVFLATLGRTGCVTDAARIAGVSTTSVNRSRALFAPFDKACGEAIARALRGLEAVAYERAVEGREMVIVRNGKEVERRIVPSDSLLGLLMVPLAWLGSRSGLLKSWGVSGVGFWPAWIALFLYAVFPVLNNTMAGLSMADPAVTEAALSLGMSRRQVFFKVQLPLAVPLILGGIRTAFTQGMGNAVLAALIGGGGLGSFIFLGLAQSAPDLILLGTMPLIALTILLDALLGSAVKRSERGRRYDTR